MEASRASPDPRTGIMLSYHPGDVAGRSEPIYDILHERFGSAVMRSNEYWTEDLEHRLRSCRVLLPVVKLPEPGKPDRMTDPEDSLTRELAIARDAQVEVLVVLADDARPLRGLRSVHVRQAHLEADLAALVRALEPKQAAVAPPFSPWRSLTDRSALLVAATFGVLTVLGGGAWWTGAEVAGAVMVAWLLADLLLRPRRS